MFLDETKLTDVDQGYLSEVILGFHDVEIKRSEIYVRFTKIPAFLSSLVESPGQLVPGKLALENE